MEPPPIRGLHTSGDVGNGNWVELCTDSSTHSSDGARSHEVWKTYPQPQFAPQGSLERFGAGTVTSWPNGKLLRGQRWHGRGAGQLRGLLGLVSVVPALKFIFYS